MSEEKNQPAKKYRLGYLTATIWRNERHFNVTLVRTYKEEKEYKETTQLGSADLLNAAKLLQRCEQFISEQE